MNALSQFVWEGLEFRTPKMLELVSLLSEEQMLWEPPNGANSVAWQLWHIAEVEDNWIRALLLQEPKSYPFGCSVRDACLKQYPSKESLKRYFSDVRELSKERLLRTSQLDFEREVQDEHFGTLIVREVWSGVVTSFAWHAGQIALTYRLLGKHGEERHAA